MRPSLTSDTTVSAAANSPLAGTSVLIPLGSLDVNTTILMSEGTSELNDENKANLGISGDVQGMKPP